MIFGLSCPSIDKTVLGQWDLRLLWNDLDRIPFDDVTAKTDLFILFTQVFYWRIPEGWSVVDHVMEIKVLSYFTSEKSFESLITVIFWNFC